MAQHPDQVRGRALDPPHRDANRSVVPGRRPLRGPGGVAECGRGLQDDGDRKAGTEAEPLLVLLPGPVEHPEDGETERLVGVSVVTDPEPGAGDVIGQRLEGLQLAPQAAVGLDLVGAAVPRACALQVSERSQRVAQELQGLPPSRIETQRRQRTLARALGLVEGELGRGEGLETEKRGGVTEEGQAREAKSLPRVADGEPLAAADDVGVDERALGARGLHPGDGLARKIEELTVLAVTEDDTLVPRLVGLEDAPIQQDDGVRTRAHRERERDRGQADAEGHGQGRRLARGWTIPFWK
jgi:hypothetical protein